MIARIVIALLLVAGVASAESKSNAQKAADTLFEKGQASYEGGKYQDAITQFKQAYELVHDPVYLFNIGQSYRKVADCQNADRFYREYLEYSPDAENKQKVEQWLVELKPCVEQRERDQEAARKSQAEAERLRKERELARQEPSETASDRGKPLRIGGIALASIGVVGLGVGIGYGIRGGHIKDEIDAQCTAPRSCQWDSPPIQSLHQDGQSANLRAKVGYIGGGIAVLAGAALYMLGRTRVESVTVQPAAGGASVTAQLSF
jgi:tetratricopeptide (TPR) repeat protein